MIFALENGRMIPKRDKIFELNARAKEMIKKHGRDRVINGTIGALLDDEGELAVIIGKRGSNIAAEDAMKYVYGYTIINDVTARDLQKKHAQWFRGKSLDTFCPMGPTVMVGSWPVPFTIYTKVNGHLRQEGSTADLIFSIPKLIEVLSSGMTLLPGDVIATGTPQGVGMGMNPPQFLRKGDEVEITIDPIGTLRNKVK